MVEKQAKQTLYLLWVRGIVYRYIHEVKFCFTIDELCEWSGLPKTHNLRRRLREMVLAGELNYESVLCGERGSRHVYSDVIPF